MARLVIRSGKEKGKAKDVTDSVIIGRGETADVRISDAKASREHCRVFEQLGRWVVSDLNSRNGITVNGVKKTRANLSHGDEIAIGRTVIRFETDGTGGGAKKSAASGGAKKGSAAKDKAFAAARKSAAARPAPSKPSSSGGESKDVTVSKHVLQFSKIDEKTAKPWDRDLSQSTVLMQFIYWAVGIGLCVLLVWGGITLMG